MLEILTIVYLCIAGFVAAGFLASLYQMITARPPQFAVSAETLSEGLGGAVLCVFGGPFIIMRNAIRGRTMEGRPLGWLAASSVIALAWSLCSGVVLVDCALMLARAIV